VDWSFGIAQFEMKLAAWGLSENPIFGLLKISGVSLGSHWR
jgi:hypothetical protein